MAIWRVPTAWNGDYETDEYDIVSDDMIETIIPEAYEKITEIVNDRYLYYRLCLQNAVSSGKININRKMRRITGPTRIEIVNYDLIRVESARCENCRTHFYMDVIVKATIEYSAQDCKTFDAGEELRNEHFLIERHYQWFRLRTYEDGLHLDQKDQCTNNAVRDIEVMIYNRKDRLKGVHFTDCLAPVLSAVDMDKEAEKILRSSEMAYAVEHCCFIDAWKLASNLNLQIRFAKLSAVGNVNGKLYLPGKTAYVYEDYGENSPYPCACNGQLTLEGIDLTCETRENEICKRVRDAQALRKISVKIDVPTIMIDPMVCDTDAKQQTAIIHECVHFYEHSLFFYLQNHQKERLTTFAMTEEDYESYEQERESLAEISLAIDKRKIKSGSWEEIDWIEWQARSITVCLRMPAKQTKRKIEELYQHYAHMDPFMSYVTATAYVISELAYFYHVSKEMAKIRMIELGYEIARGVMNFVDGKYVPSFRTSTGGYDRNITYAISTLEAAKLYSEDQNFYDALMSHQYVFAENFFCLNRPEYVELIDGKYRLTYYARTNVDNCCMGFSLKRFGRGSFYDKVSLHNDNIPTDAVAEALASIPLNALIESQEDVEKMCRDLPDKYGDTLKYHRMSKGISQEDLAWNLGMTERTLRDYEQSKVFEPSRIFFASVGRLLKLPGYYTRDMMSKAHCPMQLSSDEMKHLEFVINFMYMRSLKECNAVLAHFHLPPLLGRDENEDAPQRRTGKGRKSKIASVSLSV